MGEGARARGQGRKVALGPGSGVQALSNRAADLSSRSFGSTRAACQAPESSQKSSRVMHGPFARLHFCRLARARRLRESGQRLPAKSSYIRDPVGPASTHPREAHRDRRVEDHRLEKVASQASRSSCCAWEISYALVTMTSRSLSSCKWPRTRRFRRGACSSA